MMALTVFVGLSKLLSSENALCEQTSPHSLTTVKPPNSDHIGDGHFGHYSEVGLISEVLFVMGVFAVIIGENEF